MIHELALAALRPKADGVSREQIHQHVAGSDGWAGPRVCREELRTAAPSPVNEGDV